MNEVITKLYEIEATAGEILKGAQQYKEQLKQKVEREQEKYVDELELALEERLRHKREELQKKTEWEILQLEEKHKKQMQNLDDTYDNHLEELAEEIFKRIIEV